MELERKRNLVLLSRVHFGIFVFYMLTSILFFIPLFIKLQPLYMLSVYKILLFLFYVIVFIFLFSILYIIYVFIRDKIFPKSETLRALFVIFVSVLVQSIVAISARITLYEPFI